MSTTSQFDNYTIRTQCPFCQKIHEIPATLKQVLELNSPNRRHIQEIFPELSAQEREMIISGTCPECWDKYMMF